jgi:hypothetical protein
MSAETKEYLLSAIRQAIELPQTLVDYVDEEAYSPEAAIRNLRRIIQECEQAIEELS